MKNIKKITLLLCVVVMIFGSCLSVNAATITDMPDYEDTYNIYADGSSYHLYFNPVWNNYEYAIAYSNKPLLYDEGQICFSKDAYYYAYVYASGRWTVIAEGLSDSDYYPLWGVEEFYISNQNICDKSGNVVFPLPPLIPLQAVETLPGIMIPQMRIVTTIAVSCLAFLVGLIILRKKLPLFLLR